MAITMNGIFVNGQKATFHPEDILSGDASVYTEEIGTAVEAWMEENVTGGEQVTDTTLTLPGVPADAKATGDKFSSLKEDLNSFSVLYAIGTDWQQGYIRNDTGEIDSDRHSCTSGYIESSGNAISLTVGSSYRTKVAHYNSSKEFVEIVFPSSAGYKEFIVHAGDFVRVQVSSDSTISPSDITDAVISPNERRHTDTNMIKTAGKPADAKEVFDFFDRLVNVSLDSFSVVRGYYSIRNGTLGQDEHYARTDKLKQFSGRIVFASIGAGYKFAVRMWDENDAFVSERASGYSTTYTAIVPDGWTIAFNFENDEESVLDDTDYEAIKSAFNVRMSDGGEISALKEELDAIADEYPVNATWTRGYIQPDGTESGDAKSCYTDYIESDGWDITIKTGSGYRSKVAHYNSSKTFVEMLYDISTDDKTISIPEGDYVRIQVSSDSKLYPYNITDSVIVVSKIMYTAMGYHKGVGKPADSYDVYTIIGDLLNKDSAEYTITSGYYSKTNGNPYSNDLYAKTDKLSGLAGKAIHVVVGSDYKFTMRFWNGDTYNALKATEYVQDGLFYVPTGLTVACNFMRADGATMSESDLTAIASSFHIYVADKSSFEDVVLGSTADFNNLTETGTYRASSTYVASYTNCPTTEYGRLVVFGSDDNYAVVQLYVSYKNNVYTRILQYRDTDVWTKWTMLGGGAYLHDGDILRMASDPEAIPVGSEHLGYTAFMAATWETLLPSGYTDGDSYDASTTKIINIHVSRESSWQSTAYGSNTDTFPIYRYIFTPVNGYSKTVFLSAGCHGNEAEGYWGLYRLMKMIYFEGYKYPTLRNLRDNVRFIIVPCWNPWGLEHYRRFNAFESDSYQAWKWLYSSDHTITVNGTAYTISEVGEADVIYDTITDYADYINLWLDLHTDPYAGRTTSSSDGIDDPRGYTPPYGFYGFVKNRSATKTQLCAVMEDFYNILKNEHSFTETWHLQGVNANATSGYSPWMASLSFPCALVEVSTFMNNFTYASGSAGMMKLAQEYYGNCLAELLRVT